MDITASAVVIDCTSLARSILDAWSRRDACCLEHELNRAVEFCRSAEPASPSEEERREVLGGIAIELRRKGQASEPDEAEFCFRLLRHLAARGL